MRKKVWLARHKSGWYGLYIGKPRYFENRWRYGYNIEDNCIISDLCPELVKTWILKKHIRPGTCVEGYFNVSFKPIRRKK